jgi:hypothetical protein
MPSRNQYLAELTTPAERDAEERRLLSPAACAWVGKAGLQPWVSLLFAGSLHWVVAGGKQHIHAGAGVQVQVHLQVAAPSQVPVD